MISGCAHFFPVKKELTYEDVVPYAVLTERFDSCRGQGIFYAAGELRGNLNFDFTARGDSTFIQFRDLLGRRTLFVRTRGSNIWAWDMIHNERYERDGIMHILPFTELLKPDEFTRLLWGSIPYTFLSRGSKQDFNYERMSAGITFESRQTKNGPLVHKITIQSSEHKYHVEIEIKDREFDAVFPQLIHSIPNSIPLAQPS